MYSAKVISDAETFLECFQQIAGSGEILHSNVCSKRLLRLRELKREFFQINLRGFLSATVLGYQTNANGCNQIAVSVMASNCSYFFRGLPYRVEQSWLHICALCLQR